MKKFCINALLILIVLFSNLSFAYGLDVGMKVNVVDTILGEDSFYSFELWDEDVLVNDDYILALRKPNLDLLKLSSIDVEKIDWLRPYRIDSSYLDSVGNYDLFLLKKGERYNEIVLRDGFQVVSSVTDEHSNFDISKWLKSSVLGVGGDEILLAQAEMNRFDIDDLPSVVEVQAPISFTVQALNEGQEENVSYTGTIKIEALNDVNAVTPNDYTFVLQDAGEHRFVESIVFNSVGTKTIKITDVDDEDITAEFNIEVVDSSSVDAEGALLQIESPTSTVYSENRILVKGKTDPGLEVVVLEGGAEFYTFDAEVDGSFTELLPPLEDGVYDFRFRVGETLSSIINLEIRTGGVSVRSFVLSKNEVSPVELIDVELELTSGANSASIILNGVKSDLFKQDVTGTYFTGQVTSPVGNGQYPVNLMVIDDLGNASTIESSEVVVVTGEEIREDVNASSSKIDNITGASLDKRVKLNWSAPNGRDVLFYSIKYGVSPDNLGLIVDTNTSSTEWYVPNLENDREYYFRVFAVSPNGDEFAGSDILKISPGRPDNTSLMGQSEAETTSETGPGLWFMLLMSIALSWLWRNRQNIV